MNHDLFTSNPEKPIDNDKKSNSLSPSSIATSAPTLKSTINLKQTLDSGDEKETTTTKKKKRSIIDDDFFSLAGSFDHKRKKKQKHKHKQAKDKKSKKDDAERILFNDDLLLGNKTDEDISGDLIDLENVKRGESNEILRQDEIEIKEKSITPPRLVDDEKIKNEIATRINSQYAKQSTPGIVDSDEEIDEELEELLKLKSHKSGSVGEQSPGVYNYDLENERKRKYVIRITSKLPAPDNQVLEVDFGTKGLKTFEKILKAAVDYFKKALASKLSPIYLFSYEPLMVSLVWVEGKTLIQPFFTPRTLRVPPPGEFNPLIEDIEKIAPTMIRFFLIPKEYNQTFMNIYPEFQSVNPVNIAPEPVEVPEENSSSSDDEEEEEILPPTRHDSVPSGSVDQPVELEENDGLFVIALKGKDNKRVEVKVSAETKLRNLVAFYLKLKGLSEDTVDISHVKLIFDDEELDLNETVGDTELEEDYEIQVKL